MVETTGKPKAKKGTYSEGRAVGGDAPWFFIDVGAL